MKSKKSLDVYFNSACPVCDAGIKAQKGKTTACDVSWKDVHVDNQLVTQLNEEIETVRKYLHVVDQDGKKHIGIDAFILLWKNSPSETWKAKLLSNPAIKVLAKGAYFVFANLLYRWNIWKRNWQV